MLNLRLSQNRRHVKCSHKTTLFASLEITPDESTQILQKKRHIALAIDCSTSMCGKKMDDAKNAAIEVVRSLDPQDLISIVVFESGVHVVLSPTPASDSGSIERAIRSIEAHGNTAMHGGMAMAFQVLRDAHAHDIISRMAVFTDGEPNIEPYGDDDFMDITRTIRDHGITTDVFGIGDDYNGPLLMRIAEIGRGKWKHVSDTDALTQIVSGQVEEMHNTVITNPQLQITLMEGAELRTLTITKPSLQEIDPESRRQEGNTTYVGLNDIIKDQSQTVVMRVAIPPIEGSEVSFLTVAIVEGLNELEHKTGVISCTSDPDLYNLETDPSPRVILASSEATVLFRKGLEGDAEATRMANTILQSLDDPETTKLMDKDAHATVLNAQAVAGHIQPGMSESERKQVLHETTVIGTAHDGGQGADSSSSSMGTAQPKCPHCNYTLRPTSKVCGNCGKVINK